MKRRYLFLALPVLAMGTLALAPVGAAQTEPEAIQFEDARLRIEINSTDGDAGFQINLDGEAWKSLTIHDPNGRKILDITGTSQLKNFGLTELFSESSEPPFTEFPFSEFKKLWPEGVYTFRGKTIDGKTLVGQATFNHEVPDGPVITKPADDSSVDRKNAVLKWNPVTTPAGIEITGYQVVVTREDPLRVLDADLPAGAHRFEIPSNFLQPGVEYAAEVLAIASNGNQTLTEVAFIVE
jgi:hypothetical protein